MKALRFYKYGRLAVGVAALACVGACANMTQIPPGSAISDVQAKWGQPNFECQGPDGGRRVIWSQQPMGQYAWGANVNAAQNIDRVEPLLTDEHFEKLRTGQWTQNQVRCEFGPPAEISTVGLPSDTQLIWSYRYRQSSAWNSLMYVYFGTDGSHVTRFHPGPDPMFDHNDSWLR